MAALHSTPPPFISYSSFFASGLLAPHTTRTHRSNTLSSDVSDVSESTDACISDMEVDASEADDFASSSRRSATPTPHTLGETTPVQSPQPQLANSKGPLSSSTSSSSSSGSAQTAPRLRRRRSSLTQGANPMAAIRSPVRSAGDAFRLQTRTRSGSLGGDQILSSVYPGSAVAEVTSIIGRMRSGSCSNAAGEGPATSAMLLRPRRGARRVLTSPVPALRAPPPTAPLPALPPVPMQHLRPAQLNRGSPSPSPTAASFATSGPKLVPATSARARGMSVSSSTLGGDEHRIDEDMKEN